MLHVLLDTEVCVPALVLPVTVLDIAGTLAGCTFSIGGLGKCFESYRHLLLVGR